MDRCTGFLFLAAMLSGCGSSNGTTGSGDAGDAGNGDGGTTEGGGGDAGSAFGFTPSNFDPSQLDLTNLGDIDITGNGCGINSEMSDTRCFDTALSKFTIITEPNNIKVGVYVAHSWRIEPNAVMNVFGTFPIILAATDKMDILGGINAVASGPNATGGGYAGITSDSPGSGPGGGAGAMGVAGGGASYCGVGGTGGVYSATSPAMGGTPYGSATIVPLVGGSSGGNGSRSGGAGGGAIQLVAANSISFEAGSFVNVGGGGAQLTGAGGGSGGALLLESMSVTVAGILAANGGGGAGGGGAIDALPSNMPAAGSPSSMSDAAGGNGSAGATANGADGMNGNVMNLVSPGGGGGGAGRIRINTKTGSATLTGGTLSPDATTACMTQGTLK